MDNLVDRAREYATQTHGRINHRRKYTQQPYTTHLESVARLVASITDDPEMIAAAWLHDIVEDTPATLEDIESEFGRVVAELVEELTDVSKPSDGNRSIRKALDRQHTAQASSRSKTIKLADLIDNCTDITRNDPRFARVYLDEMHSLLDVLEDGDGRLLKRARKVHAKCISSLDKQGQAASIKPVTFNSLSQPGVAGTHFKRMFSELFTARDMAEPLLSFDATTSCQSVKKIMQLRKQSVASIRINGEIHGYARLSDMSDGSCIDVVRHFATNQIVAGNDTIMDVVHVLTRHKYCFVETLGQVGAVIKRDDMNKPLARMWLFGIITIIEMTLMRLIDEYFPGNSWQHHVSDGRLDKARQLQKERQRRNQDVALTECLQLTDKGLILIEHPTVLQKMGFESKRSAKKVTKELEALRNHLAHAQDISSGHWAQIARLAQRVTDMTSEK
jgi:hypothetical protein